MADPDAGPKNQKVSQSAIDSIKQMGMSKALKQYNTGGNTPEFKTAMERYYSPQRLKSASGQAVSQAATANSSVNRAKADTGNITASAKTPVTMPASAPAAATRKVGNAVGSKVLGPNSAKAISGGINKVRTVGETGAAIGSSSAKGIGGLVRGLYRGVTNTSKPRKTT